MLKEEGAEESNGHHDSIAEGISLFYLCHVLAGASLVVSKAKRFLVAFNIGIDQQKIAQELVYFMKEQLSTT